MLENRGLRLHASIVEVDQISVEFIFGDSEHAPYVIPVTRMHEVNALAVGLVIIENWLA